MGEVAVGQVGPHETGGQTHGLLKDARFQLGPAEIRSCKVRLPEAGLLEKGPFEARIGHLRLHENRILGLHLIKHGIGEIGLHKAGLGQIGPRQVHPGQVSSLELYPGKLHAAQIHAGQVDVQHHGEMELGPGKDRAVKACSHHDGLREVCPAQIGPLEFGLVHDGAVQVGVRKVGVFQGRGYQRGGAQVGTC